MKDKAITLNDIAARLNVSTVTVSKALRNHPDISPATTKLIKKVAEELGYTPNIMARNLSARKSNTIGVVIPKIAHFFFGSIIEHIYDIAFEHNYEIILTVSQENPEREKKHIHTLMAMKVDGIIISITQETRDYEIFELVRRRGIPIVFMDRIPNIENINSVAVNDWQGAYKAIEHAIKLGYRKIGHLAGYTNINIGKNRMQGFYDAMNKYNLEINPEWIIEGGFGEKYGYDAFMKLFKENNLPDLFFTVTYPVALGVYIAAAEVGLKIPDDIDVLCFGNAEVQNFLSPPLSCIDQSTKQLSESAMDIIMKSIKDPETETKNIIIDTELVLRGTCISYNKNN
ncbi:MAG TPA: LacI family DNA-binding transcriptional regulator [Melioribacteraceae bacterium]|nr:LacI family DNA-binding transcriptional regulator [Melioribacteraceae bacterium]